MSFREKIAWITLSGIVIAAAIYFGLLAAQGGTVDDARFNGLFLGVVILQAAITTLASIVAAAGSPADARQPRDERDRSIERTAAGGAYYPLLVGTVLAAIVTHFGVSTFTMRNILLAVIMLAEALRVGLQIVGYRRAS